MPFHIVEAATLSLADLVALDRAGKFVLKTPHVGNVYPNNLAMAKLNLPLLLVDQTIGDKNFHPQCVIAGGASETIADAEKMTSHSRIQRVSTLVPGRFVPGQNLALAHTRALREAFPLARIETTSERVRRQIEIMLPLLESLTSLAPHAWQRVVFPDGHVEKRSSPNDWRAVKSCGIQALDSSAVGWVIPNAWNILSDGIIGVLESGDATVYELSGPDMVRYYHTLAADISRWYDGVRTRFVRRLPEKLTMVMVPVADMRLVTTLRRASVLSSLVAAYCELLDEKRSFGSRLVNLSGDERARAIETIRCERNRLTERVREAARACPEIFYRIEEANCLTQYDLLAGEELFVHPWGIETPLCQVSEMLNFVRRLTA